MRPGIKTPIKPFKQAAIGRKRPIAEVEDEDDEEVPTTVKEETRVNQEPKLTMSLSHKNIENEGNSQA